MRFRRQSARLHANRPREHADLQTWVACHDADRLNTELAGRAATVIPGFTVTAKDALFGVSYTDPYVTDVTALLAAVVEGVTA
ncbi:hypothetical protein ACIBKZ_33910 [Streptomyces sp. NPDC050421]|uniref:hypothetical protein n=1 Tax=unclassified Streptomyces TaxID=2593676 RepID=UPI00379319F7